MTILVRPSHPEELAWVNQQYDAIGFLPTGLQDRQVIAEVEQRRAGLGRLTPVAETSVIANFESENAAVESAWELGGIYVLPEFRGQSVARAIVAELLRQAGQRHLYCIPFANLGGFYQGMGFAEAAVSAAPEKIRQKYRWCQQTYPQGVLLLERPLAASETASA